MTIQAPSQKYDPKAVEKKIQEFWESEDIFHKSIELRRGSPPFVFLEGPPTANGMPHPGHVLTRVLKDSILRYQTMMGHLVERKAGWDTHGLPVEIEVEKELGLKDKQGIEEYGVDAFCEGCRACVFKYESAWVELTKRIGFWVDMDDPYITLDNDYMESVWWSLSEAFKKNLLYKGHKVVPYCPRCGTALSAHEVGQGYKDIEEPSILVKFKIKGEEGYFLAWTTTPWTLPSNAALAVNPKERYVRIRSDGEMLILAESRADVLFKGKDYEVLEEFFGSDLEGKQYEPLFYHISPEKKCWYVVCAEYVNMDDGSGIVHIAPAFGEDDYRTGAAYDLPVIQLVELDGTFSSEVREWAGMFVKDADPLIIEHLKDRGLIAGVKRHKHEYPFCWRCDSPLLYYAMESWFIAMTKVQDDLLKSNAAVDWYPEHLKEGRFGSFIGEVKDWALSRNRYWGTPLPVWTCEKKSCGHVECVGSVARLKELSEESFTDYDLHRPFVDKLHLVCPKCGGAMHREPEVIDCWYDSGSAYFAQWHYPFENKDRIDGGRSFPIDFICEALDQTRGWFYSLMATSTFLFKRSPYKTVLTLGLLMDKDNQKMSKSKRNYVDPGIIIESMGADALRWYLMNANAPWQSTRFYEDAVRESLGKFVLTLWNSYNFFTTYAALDQFNPVVETVPRENRVLLDKWILGRFEHMVDDVHGSLGRFEMHKATRAIESFLIDDLSNWYLRRSRKRLWVEEKTEDKLACYSTIYEVFMDLVKVLAPFTPFITEEIYQNLRTEDMPESVHLCEYPRSNLSFVDAHLEDGMDRIRELVEEGRALRSKVGIKIRMPLQKVTIVCTEEIESELAPLSHLLMDELNVKEVGFTREAEDFMISAVKPDFGVLGPKFKAQAQLVAEAAMSIDARDLYELLEAEGYVEVLVSGESIRLDKEDFEVIESERDLIGRADAREMILFLDTNLTPELKAEGLARELIRRIQSMRKELDLEVEDRIHVEIMMPKGHADMLSGWMDHIGNETRSATLDFIDNAPSGGLVTTWKIEEMEILIGVRR